MLISPKVAYPFHSTKLAFLGCGRIAQNIIKGYLNHSNLPQNQIFVSGRNLKKTQRICKELNVQMLESNEELLEKGSVIFICVKPSDMEEALQDLKAHWQTSHTVLSLATGISFKTLKKWGLNCPRLVRLTANISVSIGQGFLPFCSLNSKPSLNSFVEELLKPLGQVLVLEDEELLASATVASASGLGFVLELLEYWLEWLEGEGFSYENARAMAVQTFLGAGLLCHQKSKKSFSDLQKEVVSPKGVTHSGLRSMRELELERILRLSFEKARLKVKTMGDLKKH